MKIILFGILFLNTIILPAQEDGHVVENRSAKVKRTGNQKISQRHPRIFIRSDDAKLGRALKVSDLRNRNGNDVYSLWADYDGKLDGWESLPSVALQYLLTGEKEKALQVGNYMAGTPFPFKEHTASAAAIYSCAIAFDWVRNGLPETLAKKIADKLVSGAEYLKDGVVGDPAVNHNYTYVSLYGFAMAALAIYGEGPDYDQKAMEYVGMLNHLLLDKDMVMDTFQKKEGAWGEGNHYAPFVVFHPFLMTLKGLTTATDRDYFDIVRDRHHNFLVPMAKFIIGNIRPDFTFERIGDVTGRVVPDKSFLRPTLELLASEIGDTLLQGQVRSFSKEISDFYGDGFTGEIYKWMMLLLYDSRLPDRPSYTTLPLAMRFGPDTYDQIMFRNSWKSDGTLITYLSGDHYTDHQHFDKGHFLIYKNGGLAVDGGTYSKMYKDSWANYSVRSLAHNTLLVYDPSELPKENFAGNVIYPDGGQRVIRKAQTHKSWQDYLEISKEYGLNTADVLQYDTDGQQRYDYVKTDLTQAYGKNVEWMDRQLLYLPESDYMVVKDRILTTKPLKNYWLLHFQERPLIDKKTPPAGITDYKDAHIVESVRTRALKLDGKTVAYSGMLFVKSLLPQKRTVSIIGGPNYRYYNRFAKKNFRPEKKVTPNREAGHWRMEVSPEKPTSKTTFLHAFEITGESKKAMVPTSYLRSEDGKMEGAFFLSEKPYVALFSSSTDKRGDAAQKVQLPISYNLSRSGETVHILAELKPDKKVTVFEDDKKLGVFRTSKAGVLCFRDSGGKSRKITIKEE